MLFQLNQSGSHKSSSDGNLDELKTWIQFFCPKSVPQEHFKLIDKNYDSDKITHSGLIYYLHACWAKELGCVLRPDMIYYTILSELTGQILKSPNTYKHLFSNQQGKIDVIIVDPNAGSGHLNIDVLTSYLGDVVANKKLFDLVTKTQFDSDAPNAQEARCMAFANMGVPFFNYLTTRCGIKSIDIQGSINDWTLLADTLDQIKNIFTASPLVDKYLSQCIQHVCDIALNAFNVTIKSKTFFNNIFSYGPNMKCGSGHDVNRVQGWARDFYIGTQEDLYKFSPSMAYVPYKDLDNNKMFVQVTTIAHSDVVDNIAIPSYGKIIFEILNTNTFNTLAHITTLPNEQSDELDIRNLFSKLPNTQSINTFEQDYLTVKKIFQVHGDKMIKHVRQNLLNEITPYDNATSFYALYQPNIESHKQKLHQVSNKTLEQAFANLLKERESL